MQGAFPDGHHGAAASAGAARRARHDTSAAPPDPRAQAAGAASGLVRRTPVPSGGRLGAAPRAGAGRTRDILVMEDDPDTAATLCEVTRAAGYSVERAADGAAGLAHLRHARYRLLLLDLGLPRADGMQVLGVLRAQPLLRPLVVIVLSARGRCADIRGALDAGADDYITLPFDVDDLLLRLQLRLGHGAAAAEGADATTAAHRSGLRIHTLGRFCVEREGVVLLNEGGRARKAGALFKYLLTQQERIVPAAEVIALLWPDAPEDDAATGLRSLLYQLRQALGLPPGDAPRLTHGGSTLALRLRAGDWWDTARFLAALDEGARRQRAGDPSGALDSYAAAVALYAGDYLPEDAYADWAQPLRESLRERWMHALGARAALHEARGEPEEQESLLRTLLRANPYREDSCRALMALLAARGRGAEALVLFRQLERRLLAEFDARPDPETQALALRIGRRAAAPAASPSGR